VIILEGCTVELAEEETEVYAFKIQFHGEGKAVGRTYSLGTQTMEDLEAWMKLVACASFDYMKLMVVELQQQLAEVEEQEQEPRPPPRGRANPFNCPAEAASGARPAHRRTWAQLHAQAGARLQVWQPGPRLPLPPPPLHPPLPLPLPLQADRAEWGRGQEEVAGSIHMSDDTLLVVL
jgi:hypothetical protein